MKKHLITFLFLLAAFAFYFAGLALPAAFFMLLGLLSEMIFWVRLLRIGKGRKQV
jgi:hypothetical protein